MLTELQRQVRSVLANLADGPAVALAGGSALIATGIVHRGTEDLDFFAAHPETVEPLLQALEDALEAEGLKVTLLQAAPTHARLLVESDTETTRVDLATDYRMIPAAQTAEGLVLAARELATAHGRGPHRTSPDRAESAIRAQRYGRTRSRVSEHNGHWPRLLAAQAGDMELEILS